MDTLTHALSGALVGCLLAPGHRASTLAAGKAAVPPSWQMVVAGAVAAAFPDIDFVLGYVSDIAYLRGHRGVTHSLLLLPLWAMLLSWLAALAFTAATAAKSRWRAFYPVAVAALLTHIVGDLITQFGTMIFAPLSDWRFGWGTTFIIDLVLSGLLVAGLGASAIWRRSRIPAATALVLVAGWVGVGAVGRSEAIAFARSYAAANGIRPVTVDAAPRPASPFNWTAIVFDGERYHYAHINTRRTEVLTADADDNFIRRLSAPYRPLAQAEWQTRAKFGNGSMQDIAREVWSAHDFAFYRWFAMFPVLDHVDGDSDGKRCATFRDLRFELPGRDELPFRYGLCERSAPPTAAQASTWQAYEFAAGVRRWIAIN
ncbi:MAG: metal-dependent hydrolase [Aromatoleum sp.]|jgi:inner membrane protein|uniref:metal-dependent hydrolase n=1 Tax=Aromatoleum sp. TaxID=2307007 RepID=UPI0028942FDD|nr:metal-dependent hydrolase [Aromatoleum sp.]MDT3669771.1 metal-dependent hydrolase [Aromatoleum sp.]